MALIRTAQFGHGTMDMEFLGLSMEKSPQILQELVMSRWAYLPLQSLFTGVYNESPTEEMLPSNMVRWKVMGLPQKPIYIISATGPFRVGSDNNEIVVSDGQLYAGAKVRLEDGKTLLYVKGVRTATSTGCALQVEVVGNNEADVVDPLLLANGRALNYITANYGEGSETGHPISWGTSDHYVGALTTHRHKFQITGDALTEAITMEMVKTDGQGNKRTFRGFLPNVLMDNGSTLLDFHMEAVERDLVWGKANFNPQTGAIFNTDERGKPVLMGDGLVRQLDSAYTVMYHPTDSITSIRAALERALLFLASHQGQDLIEMVAIGGHGAKYLFNLCMQDYLIVNGQRVMINVERQPTTVGGLDVTTYTTPFGSIKFVLSTAFNSPMVKTTDVTINGMKMPAESYDMHMFPIKQMSNGKNNIRIFAKAKQAGGKLVNRSLVFGHVQGMTGWGISDKQKGQLAQYAAMVSTGRDSEQFEVLSQKGIIVTNPSECARLMVMR